MLLGGALFPAFYHTDSGGYTEDPRVVFGPRPIRREARLAWVFALPQNDPPQSRLDVAGARSRARACQAPASRCGRVVALEVLERSSALRVTASRFGGSRAPRRSGATTSGGSSDTTRSRARCSPSSWTGRSPALPAADMATGWGSTSGAPRPWPTSATTRPRSSSTTTRAPRCPRCASGMARSGSPGMALSWDDFARVDMRVGVVVDAQEFPEARRPAVQAVGGLRPPRRQALERADHRALRPARSHRAPRHRRRQFPSEADRPLRLRGPRARRLRRRRARHLAAPGLRRAARVPRSAEGGGRRRDRDGSRARLRGSWMSGCSTMNCLPS